MASATRHPVRNASRAYRAGVNGSISHVRWRVLGLRWAFRLIFGLPRPVRRLLAGPPIRRDGQGLDMDLQLLGRFGALLESSDGGTLDQSVLAEQRRQADFAAEVAAPPGPDDIET